MAGGAGVPEGEGPRLSPRTVDNATSGQPRSRAQRDTQASPIWAQGTVCKIFGQERGEATFAREHETSRHGTVSLLAGGARSSARTNGRHGVFQRRPHHLNDGF
jgi:hypothetical protein